MAERTYNRPPALPNLLNLPDLPKVETKETNPKEAVGSQKLQMDLVPASLQVYAALAFTEGALKYGKYNWRVAGVRASTYLAAIHRHLAKFESGELSDLTTGVPHLASIVACCGILLDASLLGKVVDDRPPVAPVSALISDLAPKVAMLKELFKGYPAHQNTILDALQGSTNEQRTS